MKRKFFFKLDKADLTDANLTAALLHRTSSDGTVFTRAVLDGVSRTDEAKARGEDSRPDQSPDEML